jgi:hypothetical protein
MYFIIAAPNMLVVLSVHVYFRLSLYKRCGQLAMNFFTWSL